MLVSIRIWTFIAAPTETSRSHSASFLPETGALVIVAAVLRSALTVYFWISPTDSLGPLSYVPPIVSPEAKLLSEYVPSPLSYSLMLTCPFGDPIDFT